MEGRVIVMDWSLLTMLVFPLVYTLMIYRYVTRKYGVSPGED
jgi:hypothetical protein